MLDDLSVSGPDDWPASSRQIDWWAKWHLLQLFREQNPRATTEELFWVSMDYHNTDPAESLAYGMVNDGMLDRCFSDQELERSVSCPPDHPRAKERGELVRRMLDGDKSVSEVDWQSAVIGGHRKILPFPEPN